MKKSISIMLCIAFSLGCISCSKADNGTSQGTIKKEETSGKVTETTELSETTEITEETTVPTFYEVDVLSSINISWMDDKNLIEGEDFTINEYNQIISYEDRYDICSYEYNDDGSISYKSNTYKSDSKVGYEEFFYSDGELIGRYYYPNSYKSIQDVTISTVTNDNGQVIEVVEDIEYTSSDDGSHSTSIKNYVINYDSEGRVSSADYYINGDFDHTTSITYNSNGNILVYSCVNSSNSEYLRAEFLYSTIEAEEPINDGIDSFTSFYNLVNIIGDLIM